MSEGTAKIDPTFITALRRQDAGAFTDLVRQNEPMIVGLCRAMGLRGMDVEDAAAEAFADVYVALPGYEARAKISTWVYRIAYRVILKFRTERRKRRHAELSESITPGTSPSPADLSHRQDSAEELWAAVAKLEPRQAAAVELYYRRDCSVDEIAEKLMCPAGTIKTLLHRARAILKETLDREMAS